MKRTISFTSIFAGLTLFLVMLVSTGKLTGQSSNDFNQTDSLGTARL